MRYFQGKHSDMPKFVISIWTNVTVLGGANSRYLLGFYVCLFFPFLPNSSLVKNPLIFLLNAPPLSLPLHIKIYCIKHNSCWVTYYSRQKQEAIIQLYPSSYSNVFSLLDAEYVILMGTECCYVKMLYRLKKLFHSPNP